MRKSALRKIAEAMRDETGGQTVKSTVGVMFFFAFVAGGVLVNSASLPLSYNIAFGDSGNGSGSGGGGGSGNGESGGGVFSPRTKARIDDVRVIVHLGDQGGDRVGTGTASNETRTGSREWAMPAQGLRKDNERAIAELPFGELSNYLRVTGMGLDIPRSARIAGITVEIERSADGPNAIRDYSVRLVRGGKQIGNDKADRAVWPSSDAINTYGGEKDLWGIALTPEEAMARDFGIEIAATNNADSAIQVAVTAPAPAPAAIRAAGATDIATLIMRAEKGKKADIIRLQNALITANRGPAAKRVAKVGATGIYGPMTREAVREFKAAEPVISPAPEPAKQPAMQANAVSAPRYAITEADRADMIGQVVSIKAPLTEGDANEDVRTLQNLLIRWNAGPMARELANGGANGTYGKTTANAVAELQASLMKNRAWPAARRLIDAFGKYRYAPGSFGLATQGAEIEYLQNMAIAGGR